MRGTIVIATLGLALAGRAHAEPRDWKGAASLRYEASYLHAIEPAASALDGLGLAGARVRGFASKHAVGYLIGLDLLAGTTAPGGFAYQADLHLIGLGVQLGTIGQAGVGAALGASGAVGTLEDGLELPVEASTELALGSRVRVLARGRVSWLPGAASRQDGARSLGWADELEATLAVRWGRRYRDFGFPSGNGYFLGVAYREAVDTRYVGVVLGYAIDVASR